MTELKELLETALRQPVPQSLCDAIRAGVPVVVDGARDAANGKSHLCDRLRRLGFDAHEMWEYDEGVAETQPNTNGAFVCIWLGRALS